MNELQSLLIGIVQGITEFFPISSSGHLVMLENAWHLDIHQLFFFNVLVHLATLFAICFHYRKDITMHLKGLYLPKSASRQLLSYIIIATIPAAILGVLFEDQIQSIFSTTSAVATVMLVMGAIFICDKNKTRNQALSGIKALLIGFAQALALIPGVSRSGATLFVATRLGMDRVKAAQFSFFMAIPVILGATILSLLKMPEQMISSGALAIYSIGFVSALITGIFAIRYLIQFYHKYSLRIWGIYLLVIGVLNLYLAT